MKPVKPITREDLLHRISSGSPYEAVIVAAREARRLNRERLARQSLFAPVAPVMDSPFGPPPPAVAEAVVPEELAPAVEESVLPGAGDLPPNPLEPPRKEREQEVKVTMQALERLAKGNVDYTVAEGPIEPETD